MSYFVVTYSEDGDVMVEQLDDKEELLKRLHRDGEGYCYYGKRGPVSSVPPNPDSFAGFFIIKGEIVMPVEKTVAIAVDIP